MFTSHPRLAGVATPSGTTSMHPQYISHNSNSHAAVSERMRQRSFQEPRDEAEDGGNEVQDALVSMLKLEIGKKHVSRGLEAEHLIEKAQ